MSTPSDPNGNKNQTSGLPEASSESGDVRGRNSLPKKITILAGDCGRDYMARTGREAIQMFFRDIIGGRIKLCQLSPIGSWLRDDGEEIPFRIAPVLMRAGKMTIDEVDATLRQADLEFTRHELLSMAEADAWMLEEPPSVGMR